MATIPGTTDADTLDGGSFADTITGDAGNDTIDGRQGSDTAVYSGIAADYSLGWADGHLTITDVNTADGDDGSDILAGIEILDFSDRNFSLRPGGEFQVNATTAGAQSNPAIAALDGGGYVVCWTSAAQDGSGSGVYAQRYNANGVAVGNEFRINGTTAGNQDSVSVTGLSGGGFVVAWQSSDGEGDGVYARRYDADGVAQGGEARVNTTTAFDQFAPSVTGLASGGYAISWVSADQDGSGFGIYAQRYGSSGETVGDEFLVNTSTLDDQYDPAIVDLADGGFVAVWTAQSQEGLVSNQTGIYAQLYDASGATIGGEIHINTTTPGYQTDARVAGLNGGGFVVSWTSSGQDGGGDGVYAQRFDADGVALGGEILVNTTTADAQRLSAVTALANGGFVITWQSEGQDGSGKGVYAQRYDANGVPQGTEFLVNTTTAGDQAAPAIVAMDDGGFVVTWTSLGQDGSLAGIFAQRFDANGIAWMTRVVGTANADIIDLRGDGNLEAAGGAGNDTYRVNSAGDRIVEQVGAGIDLVESSVSFTLAARVENLLLTGTDAINGTGNALANTLTGNSAGNVLSGALGNDRVLGGLGSDTLYGGLGNDTLNGNGGIDRLVGGVGNDTYFVDAGDIVAELASAGIDTVSSAAQWTLGVNLENLVLTGSANVNGTGNALANTLAGNAGANVMTGSGGDDLIKGNAGNDSLLGNLGNDSLQGNLGADALRGGLGNDVLTGGVGADAFVFETALGASNVDTVSDFVSGTDRMGLDDDVFSAFSAATSTALGAGQLQQGAGISTAQDADDRIIYDSTSGALYYDADGNGTSAAAVQFAQLGTSTHPATLSASDFVIVA